MNARPSAAPTPNAAWLLTGCGVIAIASGLWLLSGASAGSPTLRVIAIGEVLVGGVWLLAAMRPSPGVGALAAFAAGAFARMVLSTASVEIVLVVLAPLAVIAAARGSRGVLLLLAIAVAGFVSSSLFVGFGGPSSGSAGST